MGTCEGRGCLEKPLKPNLFSLFSACLFLLQLYLFRLELCITFQYYKNVTLMAKRLRIINVFVFYTQLSMSNSSLENSLTCQVQRCGDQVTDSSYSSSGKQRKHCMYKKCLIFKI